MPQGRRTRTLTALRRGELRVLVATDVAARGIDVRTISHVINYGLPMKAEDYVHRIGRTGRAGKNGLAVTLAERGDTGMIRRIQQFTTQNIPVATIAGLEPKSPEPRIFAGRPDSRFGGRPCGPGKSFGKPFAPRSGDRFPPRDEGRFVPRSEGRFVPHGGEGCATPRERAPFQHAHRDAAARGPFDRAPVESRGHAFAPRKPAAPGAKPGGFNPQRSRPGGYSR